MDTGGTITMATLVTGGAALGAQIVRDGAPKFRTVLGTMMLGAALFLTALVNAQFATGLAVLAAVTSVLLNGATVFTAASRLLK